MAVKVEVLNKQDHAKDILSALCKSATAIETTPHFLVKQAFEIAEAYATRVQRENDEEENQV